MRVRILVQDGGPLRHDNEIDQWTRNTAAAVQPAYFAALQCDCEIFRL